MVYRQVKKLSFLQVWKLENKFGFLQSPINNRKNIRSTPKDYGK